MTVNLVQQFQFLDTLRNSGAINMFGASEPLAEAFGLDKQQARRVHALWMKTFSRDKSAAERAVAAAAIPIK